jgi:hypothetical protein
VPGELALHEVREFVLVGSSAKISGSSTAGEEYESSPSDQNRHLDLLVLPAFVGG